MKTALRLVIFAVCLGGVFAPGALAAAGWNGAVNMDPGSGVNIDILSAYAQAPPSGYMPFQIRIANHSGISRTYNFQLSSSGTYPMTASQMMTVQSIRAENDAETRMQVLLPMLPIARAAANYRPIMIQVDGYGVETPHVQLPANYAGSNDRTVFVGMSESIYTRSWGVLSKHYSDGSKTLCGSQVDLSILPPDWRALTGMQCFWLTPGDYSGLDAGRQTAVKDWVSRGGVLYVCEATPDQPTRAEFDLRDPVGQTASYGFGEVHWFPCEAGKELPASKVATEIDRLNSTEDSRSQDAADWAMTASAGKLKLNVPFLLSFIGLFAVFVGPVNLFYLARADRRHRLFWTTPALSLGASLLLIGVIVLQDGFGGNGARVSLTYLLPKQNKAVSVQEQVARTGVLLSRGFTLTDDLFLSPVSFNSTSNRQFQQSGHAYGGDWFSSRSLQAQRAEAILPTRARIQLLNAEQTKTGAPPVIVSSLPVELEEFLFFDENGHFWQGRNVRTGEQQTLRPNEDTPHAGSALLHGYIPSEQQSPHVNTGVPHPPDDTTGGSVYLNGLFQSAGRRGGHFYALAKSSPFIDTLHSIHWMREKAIYLGPVTTDR